MLMGIGEPYASEPNEGELTVDETASWVIARFQRYLPQSTLTRKTKSFILDSQNQSHQYH